MVGRAKQLSYYVLRERSDALRVLRRLGKNTVLKKMRD